MVPCNSNVLETLLERVTNVNKDENEKPDKTMKSEVGWNDLPPSVAQPLFATVTQKITHRHNVYIVTKSPSMNNSASQLLMTI